MELMLTFILLGLSILILVWTLYNLIGEISAVAFVPTKQDEIDKILALIKPKKGKLFLDLGSGDGRVVKTAVVKYGVAGTGYEIHPLLVWYSRFRSRNIPGLEYRLKSLWGADLSQVDYIYCYLSPKAMKRLAVKIQKESKTGTIIVSKAFEIKLLKNQLQYVSEIGGKKYFRYEIRGKQQRI